MIFIKTDENNYVTFIHYLPFNEKFGMNKSKEELEGEGYLIKSYPTPPVVEGKETKVKFDGLEFSYEYEAMPKDENAKIEEMKEDNLFIAETLALALEEIEQLKTEISAIKGE